MTKYLLTYDPEAVERPILSAAILKTKVPINILQANVDYREGVILIEVVGTPKDAKRLIDHVKREGVEARRLKKEIAKDEERCFDCGACIGVCPTEALGLSEENELEIDFEKCVRCGICADVCPVGALTLTDD